MTYRCVESQESDLSTMPEADLHVESVNDHTVAYGFGASRDEALTKYSKTLVRRILNYWSIQFHSCTDVCNS